MHDMIDSRLQSGAALHAAPADIPLSIATFDAYSSCLSCTSNVNSNPRGTDVIQASVQDSDAVGQLVQVSSSWAKSLVANKNVLLGKQQWSVMAVAAT